MNNSYHYLIVFKSFNLRFCTFYILRKSLKEILSFIIVLQIQFLVCSIQQLFYIKFPGEFSCEAGEKTKLDWGKSIVTQIDDETKKGFDKKWKELRKDFGKINTPQQPEGGYI